MRIADIRITPALSLDPDLLSSVIGGEAVFRDILGPTTLSQATSFGTFRLYRASDVMRESRAVSEFLYRVTNGGRDAASLLGGYAFFDAGHFLFGAEQAFGFYKEWERAFKQIEHTSPVEVATDGRRYKLMVRGNDVAICIGPNEFLMPLAAFLQSAAVAVTENRVFRITLKSELQLRFGTTECDLAIQFQ